MTRPDHATHQQIHDLLRRLTAAERDGDADTLAALLDDDFACVGPLGFVLTKPQWLAGYRSADLAYQELSTDEATVRRYNDTVLAISTRTQQATYQGKPAPGGQFRVTHIIVRRDDTWLIAGFHVSPITAPPGRPPAPPRRPASRPVTLGPGPRKHRKQQARRHTCPIRPRRWPRRWCGRCIRRRSSTTCRA